MVRFYPAHYPPLCVAGLNLWVLDVWKLAQLDPQNQVPLRVRKGREESHDFDVWSRLWWNPVATVDGWNLAPPGMYETL